MVFLDSQKDPLTSTNKPKKVEHCCLEDDGNHHHLQLRANVCQAPERGPGIDCLTELCV